MDKAKEPDPGGSDQQNLGFKKLKNWPYGWIELLYFTKVQSNRTASFSVFQFTVYWQRSFDSCRRASKQMISIHGKIGQKAVSPFEKKNCLAVDN